MKNIITIVAFAFVLSLPTTCRSDYDLPYPDTVETIKNLMPAISSNVRKEVYGNIKFNNCILEYSVAGFYPVGTPYNKSYSNIDLASLNPENSKTGADSSDYILLYFNKPLDLLDGTLQRTTNVVVIDASSNERAQTLFEAFLHLGELCRAGAGPLARKPPQGAARVKADPK